MTQFFDAITGFIERVNGYAEEYWPYVLIASVLLVGFVVYAIIMK